MSSSTIAIILFIILCPCISYIMIKRHLIPWSGGIMLVVGKDKYMPVSWKDSLGWHIGTNTIVEGFFLPGAEKHSLPDISIRGPFLHDEGNEESYPRPVSYFYVEANDGVYILFKEPLRGDLVRFFTLDVTAQHPWKNGRPERDPRGRKYYYGFVIIKFS